MAKETINRSGIYSRYLRNAKTTGVFFLGWFGIVFVLVFIFKAPLNDPLEFCDAYQEFSFGHRSIDINVSEISSAAYLTTQMMFANGDVTSTCHPLLQLLRLFVSWTLPILGILAIMRSLRIRIWLWLRKRFLFFSNTDLVLVIGLGAKGFEILQSEKLLKAKRKVSLAVLELSPENTYISNAENLGADVWIGDGLSPIDLSVICWKRPSKIWIMTSDSILNLKILDQVSSIYKYKDDSSPERLNVYANIEEPALLREASAIGSLNQDQENYWTHLVNLEESSAAWLIKNHPLQMQNERLPRVLIVGLGRSGRAILKEILLMCHFSDSAKNVGKKTFLELDQMSAADVAELNLPEVVVIDVDVQAKDKLLEELPFLNRYIQDVSPFISIKFHNKNANNLTFHEYLLVRNEVPFTHVFIAIGDEIKNFTFAEKVYSWEMINSSNPIPHIVPFFYDQNVANWNSVGRAKNLHAPGISPYFIFDTFSSDALRWFELIRKTAERINLAHNVDSMWSKISEFDRRSSEATARFAFNRDFKLSLIEDGYIYSSKAESFSDDVNSEIEHRRWNAFMLSENIDVIDGSYESRINQKVQTQRGVCIELRKIAKVHHNIVNYLKIDEDTKNKDRNIVSSHQKRNT
jgi:hypothetical protein